MASLPIVGVEAAILGMNAFKANANLVNQLLQNMGRATRLFENTVTKSAGNAAASEGRRTAAMQRASQTGGAGISSRRLR